MITFGPMTIKHHNIFNNLNESQINWEYLRSDSTEEHYYLPQNEEDYIKICGDDHEQISKNISKTLKHLKKVSIFSLGSGRSCLEYNLTKEGLRVSVSDFTKSILRLKKFGFFENVFHKDFFNAIKEIKDEHVILLSRIDTELTNSELKELFKMLSVKTEYIIFIPGQMLTFNSLISELFIRVKSILFNKKLVFCGYTRSIYSFKNLWKDYYSTDKLESFYLLKLK